MEPVSLEDVREVQTQRRDRWVGKDEVIALINHHLTDPALNLRNTQMVTYPFSITTVSFLQEICDLFIAKGWHATYQREEYVTRFFLTYPRKREGED